MEHSGSKQTSRVISRDTVFAIANTLLVAILNIGSGFTLGPGLKFWDFFSTGPSGPTSQQTGAPLGLFIWPEKLLLYPFGVRVTHDGLPLSAPFCKGLESPTAALAGTQASLVDISLGLDKMGFLKSTTRLISSVGFASDPAVVGASTRCEFQSTETAGQHK